MTITIKNKPVLRKCSRCGKYKVRDKRHFILGQRCKYGLSRICRTCNKEEKRLYDKQRYQAGNQNTETVRRWETLVLVRKVLHLIREEEEMAAMYKRREAWLEYERMHKAK